MATPQGTFSSNRLLAEAAAQAEQDWGIFTVYIGEGRDGLTFAWLKRGHRTSMGNAPSSVPYGAQSNAISTQLYCDYGQVNDGISYFVTNVSYTAPLSGGSGQTINITDVNIGIELPSRFLVFSLDSGAQSYLANTTVTFDTTNASPETLVVNEYNVQRNISYNTESPEAARASLSYTIPGPGEAPTGTLNVGPITLGTAGQSDFRLRSVSYSIRLYDGSGKPVYPLAQQFNCQPSPEPLLVSIAVDNSPIQPLIAPANNVPASSFPVPGQKSTTASIPVNCTQDELLPSGIVFNYTFAAIGPVIATTGQAFNLTDVKNYVTIPGSLAGGITALWASGTCAIFLRLFPRNSGLGLGLSLTNATPQSIDVSNTFVASDSSTPNPLVTGRFLTCSDSSHDIQFPFPNWGSLSLTNITPGAAGTSFAASFDVVQGNIEGVEVPYGTTGIERWVCTPKHRSILLSAPVA